MNYKRNIIKLYLIVFFHNLIPAYVIERLFYEQRGMTVLMVVLCEIIYAAAVVLTEIPSGILADRWGRRPLLVIGAVLDVLEFIVLLFADNFIAFALVTAMAGLSGACTSGAFNALLYDSLLAEEQEASFVKILGRINALDLSAALLAALFGGFLANYYAFELNYALSAVSMAIAMAVTWSLKEPPKRGHEDEERQSVAYYLKNAAWFYKNNARMAFIVLDGMAIAACINYLDEFWQLYLRGLGFSVMVFGVFSAFIMLIRIPGNLLAAYLVRYIKEEGIILAALGLTAAGFFAAAFLPGKTGVLAAVAVFLISGILEPLVSGYIHHRVNSEVRATVDSFQSLSKRAIMFGAGLAFGYVSSKSGLTNGFVLLGMICLVFFLLSAASYKKLFDKQPTQ